MNFGLLLQPIGKFLQLTEVMEKQVWKTTVVKLVFQGSNSFC